MVLLTIAKASKNKTEAMSRNMSQIELEQCDKRSKIDILVGLAITVTAVCIAVKSNPNEKLGYGALALLFPEIYLLQFGVRKYMLKEPEYIGLP